MSVLAYASGIALLVSLMAGLGLRVTPSEVVAELAHPRKLVRGLVLELVLVPVATVLCLRALGVDNLTADALVVLAVAPADPPMSAYRARGMLGHALALRLVLGVITAFTAAPSARWLLAYQGPLALHPPAIIARLMLFQWLPLAAGALARRWRSHVEILQRAVAAVAVASALVLLSLVVPPFVTRLATIGWRGLAAVLLSTAVGLALAALVGGRDREFSRTLIALVSLPNIGLAVALAKAANAPPMLYSTIGVVFLLRFLLSEIVVQLLARAGRPGHVVPAQASGNAGARR